MGAAPAWRLALPLGGFFALFFVAPLALLLAVSVQADRQMTGALGLSQYAAFFGDTLNLSTLGATLLVGAKATLLCLVAGYPLAYFAVHAPARLRPLTTLCRRAADRHQRRRAHLRLDRDPWAQRHRQ